MPTLEQVARLRAAIKRGSDLNYVLDKLSTPEWIAPLAGNGLLFLQLPTVKKDEWIRYGSWPGGEYLKRMVAQAPDAVSDVLSRFPETQNPVARAQFVEVVETLPGMLAERHCDRIAAWLTVPNQVHLFLAVVRLIERFGAGWRAERWRPLVTALFAFEGPREDRQLQLQQLSGKLLTHGMYELSLHKVAVVLSNAHRWEWLLAMCDVLETALGVAPAESPVVDDGSYRWRPTLWESDGPLWSKDTDLVLDAILECTEQQAVLRRLVSAPAQALTARRWAIFWRLYLDVLRRAETASAVQIEQALVATGPVPNMSLHAEYWALWRVVLEAQTDLQRRESLRGIRQAIIAAAANDHDDPEVTDRAYYRVLLLLETALPAEGHGELEALKSRLGELPHPDRFVWHGGWIDRAEPVDPAFLASMGVHALVEHLRTWEQPERFGRRSREGMADALAAVTKSAPDRYLAEWQSFRQVAPIFVCSLLEGAKSAVEGGARIRWSQVSAFGQWIIEQPPANEGIEEPDWTWARNTLARLLTAGLQSDGSGLVADDVAAVWRLVERLCSDPSPTPEEETRLIRGGSDPLTIAINAPRGLAFDCVFQFAARKLSEQQTDGSTPRLPDSVRQLLAAALDPARSRSLSVRARIGQAAEWLARADAEWLTSVSTMLWPSRSEDHELWLAAWGAFVLYGQPGRRALECLRAQYARSIVEGGSQRETMRMWRSRVDVHAAQHVAVYVLQGLESYRSEGLVDVLFREGSVNAKEAFVGFVGRQLSQNAGETPADLVRRAVGVWENLEEAGLIRYHGSESWLEELGWWYGAGVLGEDWALPRLAQITGAGVRLSPFGKCAERLATTRESLLLYAIQIIDRMTRLPGESWDLSLWFGAAQSLILRGEASADESVRSAARDARNAVLARGFQLG